MAPGVCWFRLNCARRPASRKDTMLLGMGNHFELWDKATYDAQEAKAHAGRHARCLQGLLFLKAGGGHPMDNTPPSC